jgi:hypothetical protein
MHISDLKSYSDSAPPFIDDRQIEQPHRRNSRSLQSRTTPELAGLPDDPLPPDVYKGNFIDIYV